MNPEKIRSSGLDANSKVDHKLIGWEETHQGTIRVRAWRGSFDRTECRILSIAHYSVDEKEAMKRDKKQARKVMSVGQRRELNENFNFEKG